MADQVAILSAYGNQDYASQPECFVGAVHDPDEVWVAVPAKYLKGAAAMLSEAANRAPTHKELVEMILQAEEGPMSNLWERAREALSDVVRGKAHLGAIERAAVVLLEMEKAGCVEGASARKYGPLGPGFLSGPPMDDDHPALLILEGK